MRVSPTLLNQLRAFAELAEPGGEIFVRRYTPAGYGDSLEWKRAERLEAAKALYWDTRPRVDGRGEEGFYRLTHYGTFLLRPTVKGGIKWEFSPYSDDRGHYNGKAPKTPYSYRIDFPLKPDAQPRSDFYDWIRQWRIDWYEKGVARRESLKAETLEQAMNLCEAHRQCGTWPPAHVVGFPTDQERHDYTDWEKQKRLATCGPPDTRTDEEIEAEELLGVLADPEPVWEGDTAYGGATATIRGKQYLIVYEMKWQNGGWASGHICRQIGHGGGAVYQMYSDAVRACSTHARTGEWIPLKT